MTMESPNFSHKSLLRVPQLCQHETSKIHHKTPWEDRNRSTPAGSSAHRKMSQSHIQWSRESPASSMGDPAESLWEKRNEINIDIGCFFL